MYAPLRPIIDPIQNKKLTEILAKEPDSQLKIKAKEQNLYNFRNDFMNELSKWNYSKRLPL